MKSTSHTLQEARETRLLIREACTPLDARQRAASPSDDMSSPRDEGNNIRIYEADATSQRAESASHDFLGAHSTGIATMSTGTGTGTGSLRQRAAHLDPAVSRDFVSLNQQPEVQNAMRDLVAAIRASPFFIDNEHEPILGTYEAAALMTVASDELWRGYGTLEKSIYSLFIKVNGKELKCLWCGDVQMGTLRRAIGHVRVKHLEHEPYICGYIHVGKEFW